MRRGLSTALDRIEDSLVVIVGLMLGCITLAIIYDVVGRQTGIGSAPWTVPAAEYFMIYLTLFPAPWILRHNGHVGVEFLADKLGPRRAPALMSIVLTVALAAVSIAAWYSTALVLEDLERGVELTSGGMELPRWLVRAALPVGFLLLAVELCRTIAHTAISAHTAILPSAEAQL